MRHPSATILLTLLAAALLGGCSCQRQLLRLHRRCPHCFTAATATADTTLRLQHPADTFAVPLPPALVPDTLRAPHSTLLLNLAPDRDTLYITTVPDPDTVRLTIPVTVPCPDPPRKADPPALAVLAALLLSSFFLFAAVHLLNTRRR